MKLLAQLFPRDRMSVVRGIEISWGQRGRYGTTNESGPPGWPDSLGAKEGCTMRSNLDGSFDVSPHEKITVTVRKTIPPYLASFSDLDCTNWDSVTHPDELTEVRTFTAPEQVCTWCKFVIVFDFVKDDQGRYDPNDKYTVVITGESGPPAKDTIHPLPPKDKTYRFHVSNQ